MSYHVNEQGQVCNSIGPIAAAVNGLAQAQLLQLMREANELAPARELLRRALAWFDLVASEQRAHQLTRSVMVQEIRHFLAPPDVPPLTAPPGYQSPVETALAESKRKFLETRLGYWESQYNQADDRGGCDDARVRECREKLELLYALRQRLEAGEPVSVDEINAI